MLVRDEWAGCTRQGVRVRYMSEASPGDDDNRTTTLSLELELLECINSLSSTFGVVRLVRHKRLNAVDARRESPQPHRLGAGHQTRFALLPAGAQQTRYDAGSKRSRLHGARTTRTARPTPRRCTQVGRKCLHLRCKSIGHQPDAADAQGSSSSGRNVTLAVICANSVSLAATRRARRGCAPDE